MPDPFESLGLGPHATVEDVRAARRRLAMAHHPDRGGDPAQMQAINEAADAALGAIGAPAESVPEAADVSERTAGRPAAPGSSSLHDEDPLHGEDHRTGLRRDFPSFTVEALPVETFEAMLVVASWLGEVLDDDPPYHLETYLYEPFECWCRLDVVPDAGASTVSLSVAGIDGAPTPDVIAVRDAWVANLNAVDWM